MSRLAVTRIPRDLVEGRARKRRLAREAAAIKRHAVQLNAEMQDALSLQAEDEEA